MSESVRPAEGRKDTEHTTVEESELENELREIIEVRRGWTVEAVRENGGIRDTSPLSREQVSRANYLIDQEGTVPNYCFYNAQRIALRFDDATYVEGFVLFSKYDILFDHAWVELDSKVVEVTYHEQPHTPHQSAYIGVEYDENTIRDVRAEHDKFSISHWVKRREAENR